LPAVEPGFQPGGKNLSSVKTAPSFSRQQIYHHRAGRQECRPLRQARMPDATNPPQPIFCAMNQFILALDQGTTSSRAILLKAGKGRKNMRAEQTMMLFQKPEPHRSSVAAGILACRRAGLPARRKKPLVSQDGPFIFTATDISPPCRAAGMPPFTSGRDA